MRPMPPAAPFARPPALLRRSRVARRRGVAIPVAVLVLAGCAPTDPAPPERAPDPSLRDDAGGWRQIVAGEGWTCGLDRAGSAHCWGDNNGGRLGNGSRTSSPRPAPVRGGLRFSALSLGGFASCGLTEAGQVYCWGFYSLDISTEPQRVAAPVPFTALAVGHNNLCGLAGGGGAYCGSLIGSSPAPTPVAGAPQFRTLAFTPGVRNGRFCGIATTGVAYCWLDAANGVPSAVPQPVGAEAVALAANDDHACALGARGAISCWGDNVTGQLGDGSASAAGREAPAPVRGSVRFAALALSWGRSCAVATTGGAYCWGVVGEASRPQPVWEPTPVLPGLRVDRVTLSNDHACFVTPGGAGYCFGANDAGQLGSGETGYGIQFATRVLDP
jgi:alpha-tubulin suppressor-like RCC1 family protein